MRSTRGHLPAPKTLSAHVCTANTAPAIRRNDYWLKTASERWASSEKLLNHLDNNMLPGDLYRAMWDGHVALVRDAVHIEGYAIRGGALLHIGVPEAANEAAKHAAATSKPREVLA